MRRALPAAVPDAPGQDPGVSSPPWPSPDASAEDDLRAWNHTWDRIGGIEGVTVTPGPPAEPLARMKDGAWEVRSDVAAFLGVPRWGSHPGGHIEAIPVVHRQLWLGWKALRR